MPTISVADVFKARLGYQNTAENRRCVRCYEMLPVPILIRRSRRLIRLSTSAGVVNRAHKTYFPSAPDLRTDDIRSRI